MACPLVRSSALRRTLHPLLFPSVHFPVRFAGNSMPVNQHDGRDDCHERFIRFEERYSSSGPADRALRLWRRGRLRRPAAITAVSTDGAATAAASASYDNAATVIDGGRPH